MQLGGSASASFFLRRLLLVAHLRVHRVKAIGGRRHRAFRSRHVPMLFDSPLVLPYHWPSRGNERESRSALRLFVKLSDLVRWICWSEVSLKISFRIYGQDRFTRARGTFTNSHIIFKNRKEKEKDSMWILFHTEIIFCLYNIAFYSGPLVAALFIERHTWRSQDLYTS